MIIAYSEFTCYFLKEISITQPSYCLKFISYFIFLFSSLFYSLTILMFHLLRERLCKTILKINYNISLNFPFSLLSFSLVKYVILKCIIIFSTKNNYKLLKTYVFLNELENIERDNILIFFTFCVIYFEYFYMCSTCTFFKLSFIKNKIK